MLCNPNVSVLIDQQYPVKPMSRSGHPQNTQLHHSEHGSPRAFKRTSRDAAGGAAFLQVQEPSRAV